MTCSSQILSSPISVLIWTLGLFVILILFTSINNSPVVEAKYVFSKKWGTFGSGNGQFNSPEGIVVDSSGRVYVADTGNNRIQMFRLANPCPTTTTQIVPGVCFVRGWGTLGTGDGQFNKPVDVALDSAGRVYVADSGNHRIQMFRGNGDFIRAWGTDGPGTTQFGTILSVAVDTSTNDIYVAEDGNPIPAHLHKFRLVNPCLTGTTEVVSGICFIGRWAFGEIPKDGADPDGETLSGVAVNPSSHEVYLSDLEDYGNNNPGYKIIKTSQTGNILSLWDGSSSFTGGRLNNPIGISIGPTGLVYITDSNNNRIQVFQSASPCPSGTTQVVLDICYVTKWGTAGSSNGQFAYPHDVSVGGPLMHVYVADTQNNRIQEFFWKTDVGGPGGGGISPNIAVK